MIERIKQRSVFRGFGRTATRSKSGPITLVRSRADTVGVVAVAYAIPRTVGSAVIRNRLRRQLRVAMSDLERTGSLGPGAYLVVVRPGARGADMNTLKGWLQAANSGLSAKIQIGDSDESSSFDR